MMVNNKTLYLVCDTQTDELSIHEIDWNKYSYDPIPEEDDPWSSIYGKDPFGVEKLNFELGKKDYVIQVSDLSYWAFSPFESKSETLIM